MPLIAVVLSVVLVACTRAPSHPTARPADQPQAGSPTTTTTQPTALPGPGGVVVPVFAQPYPFGTPQATVPPTTDGLAPVVRHVETDKPYVFITMDDGAVRHPQALELIRLSGVRPTLFLNTRYAEGHNDYFKPFQTQVNASVQAHTATHPNLSGKPYAAQKQEICGNADFLGHEFGTRPTLFRPPFGNFDLNTRKAAADCGMSAVVLWTATVNDGVVQFQAGAKLNAGDIVLMHFRETFPADYLAFLNRARQDGLTPVVLDDFLSSTPPQH
ncbi:peptidoglycan/xylan/chitin deacetylase (PgdA/CDA1 family) [Umezawaea tangerina]|uniref:Peptidoglycan/xylan/chitin deacetylase (PgdA/CDA1 family) n=2 Tax=Umezawaea tangerina TaxID=84725 RepID=A0A2T0TGB7_9PSEU|nr:peptidoglycan/xylan/chitin deacetylase (PgdA/CDA1 family) [Umezawaea tangerina]